jgi:hypothetical protein
MNQRHGGWCLLLVKVAILDCHKNASMQKDAAAAAPLLQAKTVSANQKCRLKNFNVFLLKDLDYKAVFTSGAHHQEFGKG